MLAWCYPVKFWETRPILFLVTFLDNGLWMISSIYLGMITVWIPTYNCAINTTYLVTLKTFAQQDVLFVSSQKILQFLSQKMNKINEAAEVPVIPSCIMKNIFWNCHILSYFSPYFMKDGGNVLFCKRFPCNNLNLAW